MVPDQYVGLNCEIKTFKNVSLLKAVVQKFSENEIVLGNIQSQGSHMPGEGAIKIHIYVSKDTEKVFKGNVVKCINNVLYIEDIEPIINYGSRKSFRVGVDIPAQAYQLPKEGETEGVLGPFPVRIKDISLTGMLLETGHVFRIGAKLEIKGSFVSIGKQCFLAQVKREQKIARGYTYGVHFLELENWQEEMLCTFLFEEQRNEIRRQKAYSADKR